ncbi:ribonuclease R [Fretibacter rubidus]|uniref:ribonuclease R n=1 Tax=Fretibacter rubidus TaxID=570162 RepID=UPI00352B474E
MTKTPDNANNSDARAQITALIKSKPDRMTRRDIARALGIKGDDRRELRAELRAMVEDKVLSLSKDKTYRVAGDLPGVMVIKAVRVDDEGDLIGEPDRWMGAGDASDFIIREGHVGGKKSKGLGGQVGIGDRALCRIKTQGDMHIAVVMKRLGSGPSTHMGILYESGRGWRVKPVDKRARDELRVKRVPDGTEGAQLVYFRASSGPRGKRDDHYGRTAEIVEFLGSADDPKAASLISLRFHNIPLGFSDAAVEEAKSMFVPTLSKHREDLRKIPLITIDPVDAKDFDDAIYASPDDDPKNKGGFVLWVAIADVAAYVTPGSALDIDAEKKGNSVYLPDRVEPMLPHELSSDMCSLRPHEDRACMAVKMRIRADGTKIDHHFTRGLMRSHARLTYAQAQEGFMGNPGEAAAPVMDILGQIFDAYQALKIARAARAPLAIELPERKINIGKDGRVESIVVKERYDAHKLIEEFMVNANVAAAEALDRAGMSTLVRIHQPPERERLQSLSDFLPAVGLKWAIGEKASTARFNTLLEKASKDDLSETVGMAVLRSQSQAYYGADMGGHFGLNLRYYAHFTSPIRRYADLVVHRALIKAFDLGEDGTTEREALRLQEIGEHISTTERRAMAAERDAKDRYIAAYMEGNVGAEFHARISGVTNFGLFLTLDDTGADGLVPIRTLGRERFHFDEKAKKLVGEESGDTFAFGRRVKVRLKEADPITGGLMFEMVSKGEAGKPPSRSARSRSGGGYRGKPTNKHRSKGAKHKAARRKSGKKPSGKSTT